MAKTNITEMWRKALSKKGIHDECTASGGTSKIRFELNCKKKAIINEDECWFTLVSYSRGNILTEKPNVSITELLMKINDLLPIGFFSDKILREENEEKRAIVYKTQQRLARNDDKDNIKRTIELHFEDHAKYFERFIRAIEETPNTVDTESLLKIEKDIF
jgi:hypothetical protein